MRLDRLLGITMELMANKRVSASALAARFEVSVRTIYRDVEVIIQSGIPVASFAGPEGGFELMNGFFLTKQHFSIEDFSMIYQLLKGIDGAVGGQTFHSLYNKLSTLQPSLLHKEKVVFNMNTSPKEKKVIINMLKAIEQSKRVAITYLNARAEVSTRKIEPQQLIWEKGLWYVDGFCLLRRENRYFRVSRITSLQWLDETFTPRGEVCRPTSNLEENIKVHLRFDLSAKPRVLEQFSEEFTHQDGFIEVFTQFYTKDYALSVILSYGDHVKIITPIELREELILKIEEIRTLYEG